MIRIILVLAPFFSALLFPYPYTLLLVFIASIVFPPTGALVGLFLEALYYAGGLPLSLIIGIAASLVGFLVHRFVKARIMEA